MEADPTTCMARLRSDLPDRPSAEPSPGLPGLSAVLLPVLSVHCKLSLEFYCRFLRAGLQSKGRHERKARWSDGTSLSWFGNEDAMRTEDRFSYVMLFCAMLLVKRSKTMFEQMVPLTPLSARARNLASEILNRTTCVGPIPSNPSSPFSR